MPVKFYIIFNRYLDKLIRPKIHLFYKPWSTFQLCGLIGIVLGFLLAISLTIFLDLSFWVMVGIALITLSVLVGLTLLTKIITGEERIINYHHQVVVIFITAIMLKWLQQPVLLYLDITVLGMGLFIACGRIGCLLGGCCHGKPHHWGVCYRESHTAEGFTPYLVGVRLFPIQAVESLRIFGVILVGSIFVLNGYSPGEALAWYGITYCGGRFFYEFARGDTDRHYFWGFSEAQWTSVFLMCSVVWAEFSGILPFHLWHAGITVGLVLMIIAVVLIRRFQRTVKHKILYPDHIREIAETIERTPNLSSKGIVNAEGNSVPTDIFIGSTSLGIKISASKIENASGYTQHYAISYQNGIMSEEVAKTLAKLISQLRCASGSNEFITGNHGVFHLLIHP